MIKLTRSASTVSYISYDKAYEEGGFEDMPRRVPDTSKAHAAVGFKPSMALNDILLNVIEYYKTKETKTTLPTAR